MKPAAERFKVGDIVRYASGVSALFRYEGPVNVGRLYGTHVLGGAIGASDQTFFDLQPASAEDIAFCKDKRPDWFPADDTRQSPTETVSHEMTGNERFLLGWLHDGPGQYGECRGPSLNALVARGFVVISGEESGIDNGFIAKGRGIMYRTVSITDAGRAALQPNAEQLNTLQRPEGK